MTNLVSKIADRHGGTWSITAGSVYVSLFEQALKAQKVNIDNFNLLNNIASNLQFIEFTELVLKNFDFIPEGEIEMPDFLGGGSAQIHNEVLHSLYKQGIIAVSAIAESICFILVSSLNKKFENEPGYFEMIKIAGQNNLISRDESSLFHKLRKLRNSTHLHIDSFDISFFHNEQYNAAKGCLYILVERILKLDEKVISIHFPYLPKVAISNLTFEE